MFLGFLFLSIAALILSSCGSRGNPPPNPGGGELDFAVKLNYNRDVNQDGYVDDGYKDIWLAQLYDFDCAIACMRMWTRNLANKAYRDGYVVPAYYQEFFGAYPHHMPWVVDLLPEYEGGGYTLDKEPANAIQRVMKRTGNSGLTSSLAAYGTFVYDYPTLPMTHPYQIFYTTLFIMELWDHISGYSFNFKNYPGDGQSDVEYDALMDFLAYYYPFPSDGPVDVSLLQYYNSGNEMRYMIGENNWADFKNRMINFIAYQAPMYYNAGDNWDDRAALLVTQTYTTLADLHYVLCVGVRVHFPDGVDQTDYNNASFTFLILDPERTSVLLEWPESLAQINLTLTDNPQQGGGTNLLDKRYLALRLGNPNDANQGRDLEADIQSIDWLMRREYYESLERRKTFKKILPIINLILEED